MHTCKIISSRARALKILCLVILLTISYSPASWGETESAIVIRALVTGAEPGKGQLLGSLFNSEQSYMKVPFASFDVAVNEHGSAILDFGVHPKGEYAVVVAYDRDGDGELDTGFLGIPTEKIGYSNNARGRFGLAKWADTKFSAEEDVVVEIRMKPARD